MRRPSDHAPPNGYPAGDGKPIWDTDWHRESMMRLLDALEEWYQGDQNVYVSGGLLVFYREGDRRVRVTPDVFVVKGVPNLSRDNFLVWQEGKGPDVVIELTSRRTRRTDWGRKFPLYRDTLRVPELFLFDVRRESRNPPLIGFRLQAGEYEPIVPENGRLPSEQLGLHLEPVDHHVFLWNPRGDGAYVHDYVTATRLKIAGLRGGVTGAR